MEQEINTIGYSNRANSHKRTSIGTPVDTYVTWIDIMGGGNLLNLSLSRLAKAVVTVNEACAEASSCGDVDLHPLNDGVFALSADRNVILAFLKRAFSILAENVLITPKLQEMFIMFIMIVF